VKQRPEHQSLTKVGGRSDDLIKHYPHDIAVYVIPTKTAKVMHVYEVRPRKDHRGVDLISAALPFGRLFIL
jgi:hypothetical protein